MMSAQVSNVEPPTRAAFVDPYVAIATWESPRASHPPLRPVLDIAQGLIEYFQRIARMSLPTPQWGFIDSEEQQQVESELGLEMLQAMRDLFRALSEGEAIKRLERDINRFQPSLAPKFARVKAEAIAQLAELRAALAFQVGEGDDIELDFDLVPDAGEPLEPADCCKPFDR
jgi:hypothetical protein